MPTNNWTSNRKSSASFHFVAGLGSGGLSAALLQPADLLKTRLQQSRATKLPSLVAAISKSPHPLRELWRGTVPSVIRTGLGSALYFSLLNALRQHAHQLAGERLAQATPAATASPGTSAGAGTGVGTASLDNGGSSALPRLSNSANLATGAGARAAAGFVLMPVTVVKVRFESSLYRYESMRGAVASIARVEGVRGFFTGFGATAARDAPYAGLYVLFYEQCKKRFGEVVPLVWKGDGGGAGGGDSAARMSISTSAAVNFVSGALAATLATTVTNPFDAVKTRLQLMPDRYVNAFQAMALILRQDGVPALFDGLSLRIARKALSSALAWTVYEEMIRRAERRWTADG